MRSPYFLSIDQAMDAFETFVRPGIEHAMQNERVDRRDLHVVVLNPCIPYVPGTELPILFEYSMGNRSEWQRWEGKTFDDFARDKARLTWQTGLSSRDVVFTMPQLLSAGDTSLWGSAIIDGVIVGVSEVQPYFDEMFARMTAAAMIGEASHLAQAFYGRSDVPDYIF